MFVSAYFNTAATILKAYQGSEPFHYYVKKYFAAHKQFGSRDRKYITQICYSFFRLGKALPHLDLEEKLLVSLFLCTGANILLAQKKPEWNIRADEPVAQKIQFINERFPFDATAIFPFKEALSNEIAYPLFCTSFLIQPDIYLRIRPGKKTTVLQKLQEAKLDFKLVGLDTISLPNTSKVDAILLPDEEVVVQDINSQQILQPLIKNGDRERLETGWDCCAASGGKSILLHDAFPSIALTVSDIRKNILVNLKNRFQRAGISQYHAFVGDLSAPDFQYKNKFDLVLCDAPCSGSGTWSRTPEQLYLFEQGKITYYSNLQKAIVSNAVKSLKPAAYFLYCTCSVFKEENEEVVNFIRQHLSLTLLSMDYFKGYTAKADTLFAALFQQS